MKFVYQNPNETALSIGKQAPIPNQTAAKKPAIKTKLAIGLRKGFWNLLIFSIKLHNIVKTQQKYKKIVKSVHS